MIEKQNLIMKVEALHGALESIRNQLSVSENSDAYKFFGEFTALQDEAGSYLEAMADYPDSSLSKADEDFLCLLKMRTDKQTRRAREAGISLVFPEQSGTSDSTDK